MPLLTDEQLHAIRQIIADHHAAFVANYISPSAVPPEVLERLKQQGLISTAGRTIEDAYVYGMVVAAAQDPRVQRMSLDEFREYMKRNPMPLSAVERRAMEFAQHQAAQYAVGLGSTYDTFAGQKIISAASALEQEKMRGNIRDLAAEAIARRKSVGQLVSDLKWGSRDWTRDWHRIAITELHNAHQQGVADDYAGRYGDDVRVAKRPTPDACEHCKRLHLVGGVGPPRIFKLSELVANGTNFKLKTAQWKPVVGAVHPHCQCQLIRVPADWGFDENWDLVPGGDRASYESEAEIRRAIEQEDELRKAFRAKGTLDFQGIPIAIENHRGSVRKWKTPEGDVGETRMEYAYGYAKRTTGDDEDEIDVYVGSDPRSTRVFVVNQLDPATGRHDETKCFLGFRNETDAKRAYLEHVTDLGMYGGILAMDIDAFKRYLGTTEALPGHDLGEVRLTIPLQKAQLTEDALQKALKGEAVGGKYLRREQYTDAHGKRKWRYWYREASAAREARAGAEIRLGKRMAKVIETKPDGTVTLEIDGKRETVGPKEWHERLTQHYGKAFLKSAERRALQTINAVMRVVPRELLTDLKGESDEERLADLQKRVPEVYSRLQTAFKRSGMSPFTAKRALEHILERRKWQPEARAVAIGTVIRHREIGARELVQASENLAGGQGVTAAHVQAVADLRAPGGKPEAFPERVAETGRSAEAELAALSKALAQARADADKAAEALAMALGSDAIQKLALLAKAFPGLKDKSIDDARAALEAVNAVAPKHPVTRDGGETVVYVSGEGGRPQAMTARYKLVEAEELKASHDAMTFQKRKDYPEDVQERAYHRDKAEQTKVIRNAQVLDPRFVVNTNPDAVNGPPMAMADGTVLGGNSRTMSMQRLYQQHPEKAAELRSYLREHAFEAGFRPEDVDALKNPVLIREVDVPDKSKRALQLLVRQMNESFTQAMDPRTMQVALGRRLTDDTITTLASQMKEDETLSAFLDTPRADSFVSALGRAGVIDNRNASQYMRKGTRTLNEDGKALVARILVGRTVDNADILSETGTQVLESIARSVPYLAQAKSAAGDDYDISKDLAVAIDAFNDLQRRVSAGTLKALDPKMKDHELQRLYREFEVLPGIAEPHPILENQRAQSLLDVIIRKRGPVQMANVFREFARVAKQNPVGQATMFGARTSGVDALRQAVKGGGSAQGELLAASQHFTIDLEKGKAGPFVGPRGGKWADPAHTIPWQESGARRSSLYPHPMVSHDNQDDLDGSFTSGKFPTLEAQNREILRRVAQGEKPLGSIIGEKAHVRQLHAEAKKHKHLHVHRLEPGWQKGHETFTVSVKGKLSDHFDMEALARVYDSHGLPGVARDIRDNADKPMTAFHGRDNFDVGDWKKWKTGQPAPTAPWETGLILGFPVENTLRRLYGVKKIRPPAGGALKKAGPFLGPKGGLWADPEHTEHWDPTIHGRAAPRPVKGEDVPQLATREGASKPERKPASLEALRKEFHGKSKAEQHRHLFTDRNTGLLNARGVDAQPHDSKRPMTARFSMEGFKSFNDNFGHEIPDGALRVMAKVLSEHMPDGVKRAGDIEGDVRDQAHAEEIAAAMSKAIDPEGRIKVTATAVARGDDHNETLARLGTAHRTRKDTAVAAGELGHRKGVPAKLWKGPEVAWEKGMKGLDPKHADVQKAHAEAVKAMKPIADRMKAAPTGEHAKISEHHAAAFEKVGADDAFETVFQEKSGLLTDDGFARSLELHPDDHVVSADLRGVAAFNEAFGHAGTDVILREFSALVHRQGGGEFNTAHPHGDEFLAHHADPAKLSEFFGHLKAATDSVVFFHERPDGSVVMQKGLYFVHGVGKTLDEADRVDLARNKEKQGAVPGPRTLTRADAERELAALGSQGLSVIDVGARAGSSVRKSEEQDEAELIKAGPFVGPRGGQWADPQHTVAWRPEGKDVHAVHSAVAYSSGTKWQGKDAAHDQARAFVRKAKENDPAAIRQAAALLAQHPQLRGFAGLVVPTPRSTPERTPQLGLAEGLVSNGVGSRSAALVRRTKAVESSRKLRQAGGHGVGLAEHKATMAADLSGIDPSTPILIVDDVFTSGNTIRATAHALRTAGHTGPIHAATVGYSVDHPGQAPNPMTFASLAPTDIAKSETAPGFGWQLGPAWGTLVKARGPFVGPRGGLWADPQHTIHWDPKVHGPVQRGLFDAPAPPPKVSAAATPPATRPPRNLVQVEPMLTSEQKAMPKSPALQKAQAKDFGDPREWKLPAGARILDPWKPEASDPTQAWSHPDIGSGMGAPPWQTKDWHPDFSRYDYVIINSSAGKDSQAMLTHIVEQADKAGFPREKLIVVHADLGRIEWEGTKSLAQQQAEHYGLRFEVVKRERNDLLGYVEERYGNLTQRVADVAALAEAGIRTWDQLAAATPAQVVAVIGEGEGSSRWPGAKRAAELIAKAPKKRDAAAASHAKKLKAAQDALEAAKNDPARQRAMARVRELGLKGKPGDWPVDFGMAIAWPSADARYCTSDLKTVEVDRLITNLAEKLRKETGRKGDKAPRILNALGIRAQESDNRAKMGAFGRQKANANQIIDRWYPLHMWSEREVWQTIERSGLPHHKAYDLGMRRLSCVFCVYSTKDDLLIAAKHNPQLFRDYLEMEEKVGASFKADQSLADIRDEIQRRQAEGYELNELAEWVKKALELDLSLDLVKASLENDSTSLFLILEAAFARLRRNRQEISTVTLEWKPNGLCVHLDGGAQSNHVDFVAYPQAYNASLMAAYFAQRHGLTFEEHNAPGPLREGDVLAKAGPFVGPRGGLWADPQHTIHWEDAPLKEGDAVPVTVHRAITGRESDELHPYRVVAVSGDNVKLSRHEGSDYGPTMPKASVRHFQNDLAGKVDLPKSGNATIDAVISGQAKFLGKGDDGLAFKVGDKVVKVSTTVPYQPENPGHRTPAQAVEMLRRQSEMGNTLADKGIAGVQRSTFVEHGDKGFQIKPYVEIPDKFTREQLDSIQDTLIAIHKAGYSVNDDIQAGLHDGKPVMFDVGKADKIPEGEDPHGIYSVVRGDMDNLRRLYEKSGQEFVRRDYSDGQRDLDRVDKDFDGWHKRNPKMAADYLARAANKRAKELRVTLSGEKLDAALNDLDNQTWAWRTESEAAGFFVPAVGPKELKAAEAPIAKAFPRGTGADLGVTGQIPAWQGAQTSPAGDRNPGEGTFPNFMPGSPARTPVPANRDVSHYDPNATTPEDLLHRRIYADWDERAAYQEPVPIEPKVIERVDSEPFLGLEGPMTHPGRDNAEVVTVDRSQQWHPQDEPGLKESDRLYTDPDFYDQATDAGSRMRLVIPLDPEYGRRMHARDKADRDREQDERKRLERNQKRGRMRPKNTVR